MAGILPGVEAARRRRVPKNNSDPPSRRSSFSLYSSIHVFHLSSNSSMRNELAVCDESGLGAEAREAKKRLDKRLQPQWRSETKRSIILEESRSDLETHVPKLKKSGSKRFKWLKLSWKSWEQDECAICLEQFKGLPLMQLACAHKFHTNCLVPWLEDKALCPCCRMEFQSSKCNP